MTGLRAGGSTENGRKLLTSPHKPLGSFGAGLGIAYRDVSHGARDRGVTHKRLHLGNVHVRADQHRAGCVLQDVLRQPGADPVLQRRQGRQLAPDFLGGVAPAVGSEVRIFNLCDCRIDKARNPGAQRTQKETKDILKRRREGLRQFFQVGYVDVSLQHILRGNGELDRNAHLAIDLYRRRKIVDALDVTVNVAMATALE